MYLLPKKEQKYTTSTSFRRYGNDIERITIYRNFDIFLDDIDMIRHGQYRLDISFGRYIVASLVSTNVIFSETLLLHTDCLFWYSFPAKTVFVAI